MTTPEAKGIFPESHPLSLRNYGLAGSHVDDGLHDGHRTRPTTRCW